MSISKGGGPTYPGPRCGACRVNERLSLGIDHPRGEQKGHCEKGGGCRHDVVWEKEGKGLDIGE